MGTFQSFWHGEWLPLYQQLALKSFIDHGHRFILYSYDDVAVPDGVELADAAAILPRERLFLYREGVGRANASGFSDLFRFRLLHQHGGWWVDTDVICLSATVPDVETYLGLQDARLVGTAILRLPSQSHVTRALWEAADRAGTEISFGEIGPGLMTRVANALVPDGIRPQAEVYPLGPMQMLEVLRPSKREELRARLAGAPFLHLWNEMLGRTAILGWVAPPEGCFMRELLERHGFPVQPGRAYSADELERINTNFLRSMDAGKLFHRVKALDAELAATRERLAAAEAALAGQAPKAGGEA